MTADKIMDRYPWVSEEDAERIADLAESRAQSAQPFADICAQQLIYDEATRLKPN